MCAELLAMSAASIDRYLAPAKASDQVKGLSTTALAAAALVDQDRQGR